MPNKFKSKIYSIIINRKLLQWLPLFWLVIFLVIPILFLTFFPFISVSSNGNVAFNLNIENIAVIFNSNYLEAVFTTFQLAMFSAILATILGFYLAYFATFLRSNVIHFVIILLLLAFLINPVIQFQAIKNLLTSNGSLNAFLLAKGFIHSPFIINDFWLISLGLIYRYIPIVFFFSIFPLRNTDLSLLESSLDLGANRFYIYWKIIFKGALKNIFVIFSIVFLLCIGNISTSISSNFHHNLLTGIVVDDFFTSSQYPLLSSHLFPFCILTFLFIAVFNFYFNRNTSKLYSAGYKKISKYKCISIGKEPLSMIINVAVLAFFVIMILNLILFSFNEGVSNANFTGFSLEWYSKIFKDKAIIAASKNTFIVSVFASAIATILAGMLAISASKYRDLRRHSFFKFIRFPFFISEILFGMSFAVTANYLGLSHNVILAIIFLSVYCLFFATVLIYTQIQALDTNIEGASLDLGANYVQTFFLITLPTLRPIITSCFLLVFVFIFNEFTIIYLVFGNDFVLLPPKLLELTSRNNLMFNALSTLMILLSALLLITGNIFHYYNKWNMVIKYCLIILMFIFSFIFLLF